MLFFLFYYFYSSNNPGKVSQMLFKKVGYYKVIKIIIIKQYILMFPTSINQHFRMISEGSCDTED